MEMLRQCLRPAKEKLEYKRKTGVREGKYWTDNALTARVMKGAETVKILILGAGAIGTMLGVSLALSGRSVTFFDRSTVCEEIARRGLKLVVDGVEKRLRDVNTISEEELHMHEEPFDLAILSVKSYHSEAILKTLERKSFVSLLTIQNGVGNEEMLSTRFGPKQIFSGAITLPVAVHGLGEVEITNRKGGIGLAAVHEGDSYNDLGTLFRRAGFCVELYRSYRALKWSKLLLNTVGNALSAIMDIPPSGIFYNRQLTKIEKLAFMEALAVMKARKIEVVDLPGYPVKALSTIFSLFPPTLIEMIMTAKVGKARGSKKPSLALDLASQSPFSEVEMLNGAVVREGNRLNIPVPVNAMLYETLTAMVKGEIPHDSMKENIDALMKKAGLR
ncbi:MAG: ketopantoate reductase family protein [Vulcanimicrobiota bacterium]